MSHGMFVVRGARVPTVERKKPTHRRFGVLLSPDIGGPKGMALGFIEFTPGAKTEQEDPHPFPEPIYVVHGTVEVVLGAEEKKQKKVRLEAGDAAVVPSGVSHSIENASKDAGAKVLFFLVPAGPEKSILNAPKDL